MLENLALTRRLNELVIGDNMHSYNTPQNVLTLLNFPFYIITTQFSDPEIISILLLTLSKMTRTIKRSGGRGIRSLYIQDSYLNRFNF